MTDGNHDQRDSYLSSHEVIEQQTIPTVDDPDSWDEESKRENHCKGHTFMDASLFL